MAQTFSIPSWTEGMPRSQDQERYPSQMVRAEEPNRPRELLPVSAFGLSPFLEFSFFVGLLPKRLVLKVPLGFSDSVKEFILTEAQGLSGKLRKRIEYLDSLPADWDGEGATSIRRDILAKAVYLVKTLKAERGDFEEPFVAPTFNGFLQLEWHAKGRSLEVEIVPAGLSIVCGLSPAGKEPAYFCAERPPGDFGAFLSVFNWYSGDEFLWPTLSR